MKANELMIGDWVRKLEPGGHTIPVKVTGIIDEDNSVLFERRDGVHGVTDIKAFEPIPLTSEILEKNGFKIVYGFGYSDKYPTLGWGYHNGIHDYCSIDVTFYDTPINGVSHLVKINRNSASGDGINTVHNCDIDYVHQLQHAIRLCGIEKEIEL